MEASSGAMDSVERAVAVVVVVVVVVVVAVEARAVVGRDGLEGGL